jgi:hypothetical protein
MASMLYPVDVAIPRDLVGKKCFRCGGQANTWRMYKSPILPWCKRCQADGFERMRNGQPLEGENIVGDMTKVIEILRREVEEIDTLIDLEVTEAKMHQQAAENADRRIMKMCATKDELCTCILEMEDREPTVRAAAQEALK